MIVSWNWLKEYVDLNMSHDDLVDRLTMSGLNHESTELFDGDKAIDLEVTSNRADCLGHIGVAREIATLYDQALTIPDPQPKTSSSSVADEISVDIKSKESCFRYTARVIKGVKIGPSPDWLIDRLEAATLRVDKSGKITHYESVNNVVDATNYVMFECGQPLHAFDYEKLAEGNVIVRDAEAGEKFLAIDHKTYELDAGMCVIADANGPVALAGVMGGADSEVSDTTTDVLIEAAYFEQLSVRNTARKLKLHSPSSFRFERNIDSANLEWASQRVCDLILQIAGGELMEGVVDVGDAPQTPEPVTLRYSQLKRLLGIEIPQEFIPEVLTKLGLKIESSDDSSITATPPSWRKDITREADLVEEVGRIYGFDKIPDNANVPMAASHRPKADRVIDQVRSVLLAAGFDEAVTPSLVPQPWADAFSPWTDAAPLQSSQPMLGVLEEYSKNIGAVNLLRRSLVPSLLEVRRINEYRSNSEIDLFETAKVYLPLGEHEIPNQPTKLSIISGRDFYEVKGVVDAIVNRVNASLALEIAECDQPVLDSSMSGELKINGKTLGWIGDVSKSAKKQFGLRSNAVVAELDLGVLEQEAVLIPQHVNQSQFPPVTRDFNFILDDAVRWAELESTVRAAGGPLLESVEYREEFRSEEKDGANKKRLLLTVVLRSPESTLTGQQAEEVCSSIISSCESKLAASLVG
ncbi:MAG: phenylalanine--tRNA ligase subunit beta [Mariniblastus sp.]